MILDEIIATKLEEVGVLKERYGTAHFADNLKPSSKDFAGSIKKSVSLIAEIKKASPSAGIISRDFDPVKTALAYEKCGASAVSVLTDEKYFKGSAEHLADVAGSIRLPVLRKDFIVDEIQIYEARYCGADAVLLIAAVLKDKDIKRLASIAKGLEMDVLLEVHDRSELARALGCGARIIGVNNRDLKTFKVDLNNTFELAGSIPDRNEHIVVSESGIKTREDVMRLRNAGINATLIGEELMRASDIAGKIRELGFAA